MGLPWCPAAWLLKKIGKIGNFVLKNRRKIGNFVLKNRRKIGKSIVLFSTRIDSLHPIRVTNGYESSASMFAGLRSTFAGEKE